MAPGDAGTDDLVLNNTSSLATRYSISASADNADTKELKGQLALTIKTINVTTPASPCDNFDGTELYTGDVDSIAGRLVGDSTTGAQTGGRALAGEPAGGLRSATASLCRAPRPVPGGGISNP